MNEIYKNMLDSAIGACEQTNKSDALKLIANNTQGERKNFITLGGNTAYWFQSSKMRTIRLHRLCLLLKSACLFFHLQQIYFSKHFH